MLNCSLNKCIYFLMIVTMSCVDHAFALGENIPSDGLSGKVIVGYQGWFGCPNDFEGNTVWQHWFVKGIRPEFFTVDLLPSVTEINKTDLCDTGLPAATGQETIKLFSSQNPNVVNYHFRLMRDHNIDGAAAQRFVVGLSNTAKKNRMDNVLKNIKTASEKNSRVFYLTYDISGGDPKTVVNDIRQDWQHLVNDLEVTKSSSYLRDHGKPVLELWGFGFKDRPGSPSEVLTLIKDLKNGKNGLTATTLIGGVPTNWRTLTGDSKPDSAWAKTYRSFDVISPWTVGRFSDVTGADIFMKNYIIPDVTETRRLGLGYLPVVFPGFSWYNLMTNRNRSNQAILNQIPRNCGQFLWKQISNSLNAHVNMLYMAMFDEVDEGTAIFPVESLQDKIPKDASMLTLNRDGCNVPKDWYLRIANEASNSLHLNEPSLKDWNATKTAILSR